MSDLLGDLPIGIDEQISCIERELQMRLYVYPKRVEKGAIKQAWADLELDRIRAVLATLKGLKGK